MSLLRSILTKKDVFSYFLIAYLLAVSTGQGTMFKRRTKYLFRNYLIDSSAALPEITLELNQTMSYYTMVVIRSVSSQPT